ncbi:MAG: hypothetical protein AVDCRST_MAG19-4930 [uncultured Thermomicrobiales bacterium]|uniref:Uncharacterized protein n=1 Tax=uncultured Thermomicrobiales bacterium TaxID=1645740 RepID=A0A6J4VVZ2_9BACT|nr:MAG: hypothetical protein AVDCRST_MAG19-4930 [uncultured Thermomicrobiales bacterium]
MRTIADFELKRFFNDGSASAARVNLSPSFAEPLSTAELLAFEPDAAARLTRLPLSYPGMHGGLELRAAIAGQYRQLSPDELSPPVVPTTPCRCCSWRRSGRAITSSSRARSISR